MKVKSINIKFLILFIAFIAIFVVFIRNVGAHSLSFSIYTGEGTLLTQFKGYYGNATAQDILMDDNYNNPPRVYLSYWNRPQIFGRMILADNYSELTSETLSPYINDIPLAESYNFTIRDYIALDLEDWPLTPIAQQENQALYTQEACAYVHSAGYSFAFTPEIDVPRWINLASINWTCVNFFDVQEQFLSNNPSELVKNVTEALSSSESKNPNLDVFVQIDIGPTKDVETEINDLSQIDGVDGIILQDLNTSEDNNLTTLVNYVKSFNTASNFTVTTTSATTSTTTSIITTTSLKTTTTIPITSLSTSTSTIRPITVSTSTASTTTINLSVSIPISVSNTTTINYPNSTTTIFINQSLNTTTIPFNYTSLPSDNVSYPIYINPSAILIRDI